MRVRACNQGNKKGSQINDCLCMCVYDMQYLCTLYLYSIYIYTYAISYLIIYIYIYAYMRVRVYVIQCTLSHAILDTSYINWLQSIEPYVSAMYIDCHYVDIAIIIKAIKKGQ